MEANQSSSLIPSTVEVAMQYIKFLVKGLKAGHAEFSKLYACTFCRSRSGSAMQAALRGGLVEGYTEALFVPPMPLLADDKYYMDMVATADAKSELH